MICAMNQGQLGGESWGQVSPGRHVLSLEPWRVAGDGRILIVQRSVLLSLCWILRSGTDMMMMWDEVVVVGVVVMMAAGAHTGR